MKIKGGGDEEESIIEELIVQFVEYLRQFSYWGVIFALTIEAVPAEIVLPLVGYWVSQGDMNFYLAVLAGTVGGTLGPLTLYAVGRYGGRPFAIKYGKFFLVKEHHIDAADAFFQKYGGGVAFGGRFIPGVRTAISIPCGMAKMNVGTFSMYTFLAMLPITALYVHLGVKLGENWESVGPLAAGYLKPAAMVILLIVIGLIAWKKFKKKKPTQ